MAATSHKREARAAKRDGRALSDAQIIRLVDELPDTPAGHRWRFAVQLLATFGLRPEELRFFKIEDCPVSIKLMGGVNLVDR